MQSQVGLRQHHYEESQQYASKFGKLSSGHRNGKGQFSFQSQRKAMPKNAQSESEAAQSCLTLCDPWTVAHQAPPFMGFSRQEYWSGLPFPSPGDLPDPGIEPRSPTLQADAFNLCTVTLKPNLKAVYLQVLV